MTAMLTLLEQRLVAAYREQLRHYDQAFAIVEQQALQTTLPHASATWVRDLNGILHTVGTLDAQLADDKSAWRASGQAPGPELKELLDRLAERIRSLSERINHLVADLQTRQQKMLPEIDEFLQQRRMLQAYGSRR